MFDKIFIFCQQYCQNIDWIISHIKASYTQNLSIMEYLNELVALGVDGLILGLCLKEYFSYKKALDVLKVCVSRIIIMSSNIS